jgi:hypothetical protein
MMEAERASKLDELDRLLNDPDVPMEPHRVWSLLAEIAESDLFSEGRYELTQPQLKIPDCPAGQ